MLRKVFEEKAPNARELKTIFLAFGRSDRWDDELSKYIETHRDEWGKSLVVTEKINRGHTISAIQAQLDNAHYSDYDFASLYSDLKEEVIKEILADSQWRGFSGMKNRKSEHQGEVYTGGYSHDEIKHKYGGVKRRVINSLFWDENRDRVGDYSIGTHPERIDKLIEFPEPSPQTLEAQAELLGFYQMSSFPSRAQRDIEKGRLGELREKSDKQELSEEQKREIQDTINKARQDVDRLAHQIINDVWKSKEEDSV